jgi:hypothetical protein
MKTNRQWSEEPEHCRALRAVAMAEADSWHPARMHESHLGNASPHRTPLAVHPLPDPGKRRTRHGAAALKISAIVVVFGVIAAILSV